MGKITKEQQTIIDSLTCERLTKDEANKTLIQDFENNRNKGLADSLREEAWEEDANGSVAYYLIKDKDGNALFFFSLKCGALFEQLNEERLKQNANYPMAFRGIGRTVLRQNDYEGAMEYFKMAHDRENYGRVFKLYRKEWIEKNIGWLFLGLALVLIIPLAIGRIKRMKWEVIMHEQSKVRQ